ncbi:PTS sugar transporter subunit IIB [Desulfonatronovibrio hydrogenovorans]|uniref:PTS sugar transporter subunit IIB n=1 Tax=Desulfonatronovibrio hydrogenovorans TaxID=53245 RepID=UPI00048F48A9|nr:PTS sugar transporter subunit IIB [Desulfonatronovibrio hydrogenovorans]
MFWVRIDNRLIHGQVIETWIPFTRTKSLLVVNDELASDPIRQEIMGLAVPQGVEIIFAQVNESIDLIRKEFNDRMSSLFILFSKCSDARQAFEKGLMFSSINIGNLHYGPGKKQICSHIALSRDDSSCLKFFSKKGVKLDFRCVPHKQIQVDEW